jgi:hypothetical protein
MTRTKCGATRPLASFLSLIVVLAITLPATLSGAVSPPVLKLDRGWRVQSSAKVSAEGSEYLLARFPHGRLV